jgi:hypothetical protein
MEKYSFDSLSKEVANGSISRGKALKLASAALLGSALGAFSLSEDAQARRRGRNRGSVCRDTRFVDPRCATVGCSQGCAGANCSCIQTTENDFLCTAQFCPQFPTSCTSSTQCPGGQVCMVNNCCSFGSNICVTLCGSVTPFSASTSEEGPQKEWNSSAS